MRARDSGAVRSGLVLALGMVACVAAGTPSTGLLLTTLLVLGVLGTLGISTAEANTSTGSTGETMSTDSGDDTQTTDATGHTGSTGSTTDESESSDTSDASSTGIEATTLPETTTGPCLSSVDEDTWRTGPTGSDDDASVGPCLQFSGPSPCDCNTHGQNPAWLLALPLLALGHARGRRETIEHLAAIGVLPPDVADRLTRDESTKD